MSKIKVHVFEFFAGCWMHVAIFLEQKDKEGTINFYHIDRWTPPEINSTTDEQMFLQHKRAAFKTVLLEIDGDLDKIIKAWNDKYYTDEYHRKPTTLINLYLENCADTSAWFLATFANIPNPGSCGSPVTCNYVCCGFFAPSFLQCCTLPGRVVDYTEKALNDRTDNSSSGSPLIKKISRAVNYTEDSSSNFLHSTRTT